MTFFQEETYSFIIDNIYLGSVFDLNSDVINKVSQVISLVDNPMKNTLIKNNIDVYEFIFPDSPDVDIIKYSEQVYEILKNNKPTFIHCFAGKSRSVSCVLYYIIKKHNLHFTDAYAIVEKRRHSIDLNIGFYAQLMYML
jgi:protein-tyrosine phosphatase